MLHVTCILGSHVQVRLQLQALKGGTTIRLPEGVAWMGGSGSTELVNELFVRPCYPEMQEALQAFLVKRKACLCATERSLNIITGTPGENNCKASLHFNDGTQNLQRVELITSYARSQDAKLTLICFLCRDAGSVTARPVSCCFRHCTYNWDCVNSHERHLFSMLTIGRCLQASASHTLLQYTSDKLLPRANPFFWKPSTNFNTAFSGSSLMVGAGAPCSSCVSQQLHPACKQG